MREKPGMLLSRSSSNSARFELDRLSNIPGFSRIDNYLNSTATVQPGVRRWHAFTVEPGVRYWIDGCHSGVHAYVIPGAELGSFQSGGAFQHYPSYGGDADGARYGAAELRLAPGTYYLAQHNATSTPKTITYTLERWRPIAKPQAPASTADVAAREGAEIEQAAEIEFPAIVRVAVLPTPEDGPR